jgi:hypothetical protein
MNVDGIYRFHILDTGGTFLVFGQSSRDTFAEKLASIGFKKFWAEPYEDWELIKDLLTKETK